MRFLVKAMAFLTVATAGTVPASAAVLVSLNRATFQSALAGSSTLGVQNFDGIAAGTQLGTIGGITFGSSAGTPVVTNAFFTSTGANGLGRTPTEFFADTDIATFRFGSAITAFAIDINTFATANGSYDVVLNTGDQVFSIFEAFPGIGTGQFIGFVSDTPFTNVSLTANTGFAFSLDTIVFGARDQVVSAVPEPQAWAMMLLGFGVVGYVMRTRAKQKLASL